MSAYGRAQLDPRNAALATAALGAGVHAAVSNGQTSNRAHVLGAKLTTDALVTIPGVTEAVANFNVYLAATSNAVNQIVSPGTVPALVPGTGGDVVGLYAQQLLTSMGRTVDVNEAVLELQKHLQKMRVDKNECDMQLAIAQQNVMDINDDVTRLQGELAVAQANMTQVGVQQDAAAEAAAAASAARARSEDARRRGDAAAATAAQQQADEQQQQADAAAAAASTAASAASASVGEATNDVASVALDVQQAMEAIDTGMLSGMMTTEQTWHGAMVQMFGCNTPVLLARPAAFDVHEPSLGDVFSFSTWAELTHPLKAIGQMTFDRWKTSTDDGAHADAVWLKWWKGSHEGNLLKHIAMSWFSLYNLALLKGNAQFDKTATFDGEFVALLRTVFYIDAIIMRSVNQTPVRSGRKDEKLVINDVNNAFTVSRIATAPGVKSPTHASIAIAYGAASDGGFRTIGTYPSHEGAFVISAVVMAVSWWTDQFAPGAILAEIPSATVEMDYYGGDTVNIRADVMAKIVY